MSHTSINKTPSLSSVALPEGVSWSTMSILLVCIACKLFFFLFFLIILIGNVILQYLTFITDIVIGPSLILLNKYILDELSFPFPIFLSCLGVLTSALVARIIIALGFVTVEKKEAVLGHLWYRRVLPVGLAHALSLSTGNAVYLLLNVGLIQMLKSFTPVIVMVFLFIAGVEKPTR